MNKIEYSDFVDFDDLCTKIREAGHPEKLFVTDEAYFRLEHTHTEPEINVFNGTGCNVKLLHKSSLRYRTTLVIPRVYLLTDVKTQYSDQLEEIIGEKT